MCFIVSCFFACLTFLLLNGEHFEYYSVATLGNQIITPPQGLLLCFVVVYLDFYLDFSELFS